MIRAHVTVLTLVFAFTVADGGALAQSNEASLAVRLRAVHDTGVIARAVLTPVDGLTSVRIVVSRGDGTYLPYLHHGTCDVYAAQPQIPLALVTADSPSETLVDLPLAELAGGGYVLDLHVATGTFDDLLDPATSVACGAIGETAATPAPTVAAPVTGVGPDDGGAVAWLLLAIAAAAAASLVAGLRLRRPLVRVRARVVRRRYREMLS